LAPDGHGRPFLFYKIQAEEELEAEVQDIADEDLKLKLQGLVTGDRLTR